MINFLRFDPATGKIVSKGYMDPEAINQQIIDGNPIIKYEADQIDINTIIYDIETKELKPVEYTPPEITVPKTISFGNFMNLFTGPEKIQIVSSPDPQVKLFTLMASGAGIISVESADFISGLNYLVAMGILTEARKDQIANLQPPE